MIQNLPFYISLLLPFFKLSYSNVPEIISQSPYLLPSQSYVDLAQKEYENTSFKKYLTQFELNLYTVISPGVKEGTNLDIPPWAYELDYTEYGPIVRSDVKLVQPLYTFGKYSHLEKAAEHNLESARYSGEREKLNLIYMVRELIIRYSTISDLLNMVNESIENIDKVLSKVEKNPDVEEKDLNRLKGFKSLSLSTARTLEYSKESIVEVIKNFLGRDDIEVEIMDFYPEDITPQLLAFGEFQFYFPEIKEEEEKLKSLHEAYMGTRAKYYPDFLLIGEFKSSYAPHWPKEYVSCALNPNCISYGAGVGVRLNLNFFQTYREIQKEKARYTLASNSLNIKKRKLNLQVKNLIGECLAISRSYTDLSLAVKYARSNLIAELLNFDVGIGDVKDLIDAYREYLNLKKELYKLRSDFALKISELSKLTGMEIIK